MVFMVIRVPGKLLSDSDEGRLFLVVAVATKYQEIEKMHGKK